MKHLMKMWRKKHQDKKQEQKKLQLKGWWQDVIAGTMTIQEYQKREKELV